MAPFFPRWARHLAVAGLATGALCAAAPAAQAAVPVASAHAVPDTGRPAAARVAVMTGRADRSLDGFVIGHLPDGIGTPSDYEYEWDDVAFHTRHWESRVDDGWRVDLTVQTLRGDRLTDLAALREYLTEYLEKDPGWRLTPFRNGPYRGYLASDQVFWLVRPGLAASVGIDTRRFAQSEMVATARGFQPA